MYTYDVDPFAIAFTMNAGVCTLAFDNPGTGESPVPLDGHADEIIRGIAEFADRRAMAGSPTSGAGSRCTAAWQRADRQE